MDSNGSTLVLLNPGAGITLISDGSPLTRLNYFDGKFLRAEDLQAEQTYLRRLVQMSNQAHGAGVVHGFEVTRGSGDRLRVAPGLAIDNEGRTLFLGEPAEVSLAALLAQAGKIVGGPLRDDAFGQCIPDAVEGTGTALASAALYLLGITFAEALCGHEDVYGQLCQKACITETARPFRVEGVSLQARPLGLNSPLPTSTAVVLNDIHLRSRVASAYFADERASPGNLMSEAGLASSIWCAGAPASVDGFVPLGVLARAGGAIRFIDLWTARRERGAPHPVRYWQNRLAMRPWDVFIAQVLQFQCQLRDSWGGGGEDNDPCADERALIAEASAVMSELEAYYRGVSETLAREAGSGVKAGGAARYGALLSKLQKAKAGFSLAATKRILISKGIVELPPGGYLPVIPDANLSVNEQVRRLLGEGVDLRFCCVRPDYIPHALEQVQHMDRISLLKGLDDPSALEEVDILVPDGDCGATVTGAAVGWEGRVSRLVERESLGERGEEIAADPVTGYKPRVETAMVAAPKASYERSTFGGAARTDVAPGGELSFFYAGLAELEDQTDKIEQVREWAESTAAPPQETLWRVMNAEAPAAPKAEAAEAPSGLGIGAGYAKLRKAASAYRAETAARAAKGAGMRGQKQFTGVDDEQPVDHAAMWIGARIDRDPFSVAEQERVGLSLDFSYLQPRAKGSLYFDLALTGRLVVEGRRVSGANEVLQGTLIGSAVERIQLSSISDGQRVVPIQAPVVVTRRVDGGEMGYSVNIDLESIGADDRGLAAVGELTFRLRVGADRREAEMMLTLQAKRAGVDSRERSVRFMARLRRNDAALHVGNPLRVASETSIEVIATRDGASFAAEAQKDLFHLPEVASGEVTVRATRDWVMFHRRRARCCGEDTAPADTAVRRFQIYHARATSDTRLKTAKAAVLAADPAKLEKAGFQPVMVVEYRAGRATLVTPAADVIADWESFNPAPTIAFGAIGSLGAAQAEGEGLARARLSTFELTVSQAEPPQADNQVLPVLPDLGLSGLDGVMFLVTLEVKAKPTRHAVFQTDYDGFEQLVRRAGLAAALKELGMEPVAEVVFPTGAAAASPESIDALRVAMTGYGPPRATWSFYPQPDDAARKALFKAQGTTISEALGGDLAQVGVLQHDDVTQITDCEGVTVIWSNRGQTPVTTQKVALLTRNRASGTAGNVAGAIFEFLNGAPVDAAAYENELKRLSNLTFRQVQPYAPATDRTEPGKTIAEAVVSQVRQLDPTAQVGGFEVIPTAERDLMVAKGLDPDSYDLVVYFR